MSALHVRVRVDVDDLRVASCERDPRIRLFATAPATCTRTQDADVYDLRVAAPCVLPPHAYVGVDLYTSILNKDRAACDVHSAYETADLYQLAHAPVGTVLPLRLRNRCVAAAADDAHKGLVRLVVVQRATPTADVPPRSADLAPLAQRMQRCMERGVATLDALKPTDPLLDDVLAPCYTTRLMDLPGVAYWMVGVPLEEAAAEHMLDVVLRRHDGLTHAQFLALPPRDVAPLLAEFVTALPSSMPYVADVWPDSRTGRLMPFESFDDLFTRHAGDCEDASRAVVALFNAVRFGTWRRKPLRHLQHAARYYAAFGVLGTIRGPGGTRLAHMHAELHPIAQFCDRAGVPLRRAVDACEGTLPVLVGEATIHMCCDFSGRRRTAVPQDKALQRQLPRGFELERVQQWGDKDLFYDLNAHMYTDYFFRLAREEGRVDASSPAFFSCMRGASGTYGTKFGDVVSPIHVRARYAAADVADMRRVLAFNAPTPPLRAPRIAPATAAALDRIGASLRPRGACSVVYVSTPDTLLSAEFERATRGATAVRVMPEVLAAGYAPAQRVEVEW